MTNAPDSAVYEVLLSLVRSLVDRPAEVEIRCVPTEAGTVFNVLVAPSDIGSVIGLNGRTARALRTIINANAARLKRSYSLDIAEKP